MKEIIIDLSNELNNNSRILTGAEAGCLARKKYNLDKIELEYDKIIIYIPETIYSVSPSFLFWMLGISIRKFRSEDAFLEKYQFNCDETVIKSVFDAIKRALKTMDTIKGDKIMKNELKSFRENFKSESLDEIGDSMDCCIYLAARKST